MNQFLIGNADKTETLLQLARPPFLLIDDGPIAEAFSAQFPKAKQFDISRHSFNPLKGMDYKRARDFAATIYTASPEGKDTLTVRNGRRSLAKLLLTNVSRLDKLAANTTNIGPGAIEAIDTIDDLLLSPMLRQVLCSPSNFTFVGRRGEPISIIARIDRTEFPDFDSFVLASLLIGQFLQGQVIVPDFGFYGRDFYTSLIRQGRVVVAVKFLGELSPLLRQSLLSNSDKHFFGLTREDAERLIFYSSTPTGNPTELM